MKLRTLSMIIVLGLQTAWILGTTVVQERNLSACTCIMLETRPVDPRDLIRGDFVTLNYKASDLPSALFNPPVPNPLPTRQAVFVALERHGECSEPVAASTLAITRSRGQVVLAGKVQSDWRGVSGNSQIHLLCGLERSDVREGTGNPRGKRTVEAAIPSSGN